jgi:hypothetical protein
LEHDDGRIELVRHHDTGDEARGRQTLASSGIDG